jgi:hypothetical protein
MAVYVHARGGDREEHLQDIPNRIQDTVELNIHRGVAVVLTVA